MKNRKSLLTLLGGGGGVAPATLLMHDDFIDPNGTADTAHAMSPVNTPGWSWGGSNNSIDNNQMVSIVNANRLLWCNSGGDGMHGIQLNNQDCANDNYVACPFVGGADTDRFTPNAWNVGPYKYVIGVDAVGIVEHATVRASKAWTRTTSHTIQVEVLEDTTINLYVDDVFQLTYGPCPSKGANFGFSGTYWYWGPWWMKVYTKGVIE